MKPSKIIAFSLAVVLVGTASAALAKLVRQYMDVAANGEPELVCEYKVEGRIIEKRYPIGNFCPNYLEVASGEHMASR